MQNTKVIAVSFTLKGQDFAKIAEALRNIKQGFPDNTLCVHGFMPKEVVEEKGFSTEVVDTLDEIFPHQKCFFNKETGKPNREKMAEYVKATGATVFIVGEANEGVAEELEFYKNTGNTIKHVALLPDGHGEPKAKEEEVVEPSHVDFEDDQEPGAIVIQTIGEEEEEEGGGDEPTTDPNAGKGSETDQSGNKAEGEGVIEGDKAEPIGDYQADKAATGNSGSNTEETAGEVSENKEVVN